MFYHLRLFDCFSIFMPVNQGIKDDRIATYHRLKKGGVE